MLFTTPLTLAAQQTSSVNPSVTVHNDREVPVTVYVENGSLDSKIGVVEPLRTATLPLPRWAMGKPVVSFDIHPARGLDLEAKAFDVRPGATLGLVVRSPKEVWADVSPAGPRLTASLPQSELGKATVTVENSRKTDELVLLERGSFETPLGTVPANSTETFLIPAGVVGSEAQIVLHAHKGGDLESESLVVRAGEHLGLRVTA
jgi:hypothetical protein